MRNVFLRLGAKLLEKVVEIKGLEKVYKSFLGRNPVHAVKNMNLEVFKGEVFGLLGPNGSGKTTTIKLILSLVFPTSGTVTLLGSKAGKSKSHSNIGYLPEESYLYKFLNADEILHFYGKLFNIPTKIRKERIDKLIKMVGLESSRRRALKSYSKGMMRRIGIAQALINDPQFVILDEPTSGLDPIGSKEVKDLILNLKAEGKTVLLCSHLLSDVEDVCDRIAIMYGGKIECLGEVKDLLTVTNVVQIETNTDAHEMIHRWQNEAMDADIPFELKNPRRKLEDLFLEIVNKNKK